MNPLVSVIMPVYNRQLYVNYAIESILAQSFQDFELIIIDDGSTDNTIDIIKQYNDPRIKLIRNDGNFGVAITRNIGYRCSKGEYITVSDSDDINHKDRLLKQVTFLEENSSIDVVGFYYQEIYLDNRKGKIVKFANTNEEIRSTWLFNPGNVGIPMFRKKIIESNNSLYHDVSYKAAIDYQWYTSLNNNIQIGCIPEVLYYYRRHEMQISTKGHDIQQYFADKIRLNQLKKLGLEPTNKEFYLHRMLSNFSAKDISNSTFLNLINWCEKIKEANENNLLFNQDYLNKTISNRLLNLLNNEKMYNDERYLLLMSSNFSKFISEDKKFKNTPQIDKVAAKIKSKTVYIFGTKRVAFLLNNLFINRGILISNFIDSNKENHFELFEQIKVMPIELIENIGDKVFLISILSDSRIDVKNSLIKLGATAENIFLIEDLGVSF